MKNTYIIVRNSDGKAMGEFYNKKFGDNINTEKYTVMTAAEYLPTLNNKRIGRSI